MASKKRTYIIEVGEQSEPYEDERQFQYQYNRTKDIKLKLAKNQAHVTICMARECAAEKFASHPYFYDALYKISFSHILQFGTSIEPNKLAVRVDDVDEYIVFGEENPNGQYPLKHALSVNPQITLLPSLSSEPVMQVLLDSTRMGYLPKSTDSAQRRRVRAAKGSRLAALTALVLSKTRATLSPSSLDRYERFVYLWMAMNGYLNALVPLAFDEGKKPKDETEKIEYCLQRHGLGEDTIKKNEQAAAWEYVVGGLKNLPEVIPDAPFNDTDFNECFAELMRWMKKWDKPPKRYNQLKLEGYLTFCLPYYLRCRYFHGEEMPPVFAKDTEPRYAAMNLCSELLDKFLTAHLGEVFELEYNESEDE